jgi:hypothetical protein
MRIGIELRGALSPDARTRPGDPTVPVFYVTAATMIQALPAVIAAAPGIKTIDYAANSYWKQDMRKPA